MSRFGTVIVSFVFCAVFMNRGNSGNFTAIRKNTLTEYEINKDFKKGVISCREASRTKAEMFS